jgi:hypothetical protein
LGFQRIPIKTPRLSVTPLDREARDLHEKDVLCARFILSFLILVLEIIDSDRKRMMMKLLPSMVENFILVDFEKMSFDAKFFPQFTDHPFMEGFAIFHVATREHPWSIWSMLSEEDLTFRIEEKCTDNRFHSGKK